MDLRKGAEYTDYVARYEREISRAEELIGKYERGYSNPTEEQKGWLYGLLLPLHETLEIIAAEALRDGFTDLALNVLERANHLVETRERFQRSWGDLE